MNRVLLALASMMLLASLASCRSPTPTPTRTPTAQPTSTLTLTPLPSAPPHPTATIPPAALWTADFETGDFSQWLSDGCGGRADSDASEASVSAEIVHTGRLAAKMTITATGGSNAVRLIRWCESRQYPELYYSAWYYFPQRVDATGEWWNVWQWKSNVPGAQEGPWWILNMGNVDNQPHGAMYFTLFDWIHRVTYDQAVAPIPVGRWFQVEAFYRCAADATGSVRVWQDGVLLFDLENVQTRYAGGDCYWGIGNYAGVLRPNAVTIYVDDAAIGLER